jgi:hypothetical protein
MKKILLSIWNPIISLIKDNPSDKKLSMGRISWIVMLTCDLFIWFGGNDVPQGMLTVTVFLLLYVTGTKALGKITNIASLASSIKKVNEGIGNVEEKPKKQKTHATGYGKKVSKSHKRVPKVPAKTGESK